MSIKRVSKDEALHRIEFTPDEETAKRVGSPALAYVTVADVERMGVGRSFTVVTGLPYHAIVRVRDELVDRLGNRVELLAPSCGSR